MIELSNLTKRYGRLTVVDDVTFTVHPGEVTGFLGPNGAGKSTAMRMICGLTPPTSGRATVLGTDYRRLPNPGRHVGTLLDAGAQHVGRSGREVLSLSAQLMGLPRHRVDEVIDLVGLTPAEARRRVGTYSLGMKQRLGVAHALLGDPEVLILDEPANGLDPAGIRWMRDLLRRIADDGGTVLLSSHLLHEVERIADTVVMIGRGRLVAQGRLADLTAASTGMVVNSANNAGLAQALTAAGYGVASGPEGLTVAATAEQIGAIALAAGIALTSLAQASSNGLEELFLHLTADSAREDVAA